MYLYNDAKSRTQILKKLFVTWGDLLKPTSVSPLKCNNLSTLSLKEKLNQHQIWSDAKIHLLENDNAIYNCSSLFLFLDLKNNVWDKNKEVWASMPFASISATIFLHFSFLSLSLLFCLSYLYILVLKMFFMKSLKLHQSFI